MSQRWMKFCLCTLTTLVHLNCVYVGGGVGWRVVSKTGIMARGGHEMVGASGWGKRLTTTVTQPAWYGQSSVV